MKTLLLVGAGHAHLEVLRRFARDPPPARLVLLTPSRFAHYSGALPGLVAGELRPDEARVDAAALARRAGARLVLGEAAGLDPGARRALLRGGGALAYDLCSLNVGSAAPPPPEGEGRWLAVRPAGAFLAGLDAMGARLAARAGAAPRVAVVGAGAAGVELALALERRFRGLAGVVLVGTALLPGFPAAARRRAARALGARGVALALGARALRAEPDGLALEGGGRVPADESVWAPGAAAPAWLAASGLPVDAAGHLLVDATLRVPGHPALFAAGDAAAVMAGGGAPGRGPLPRSGVYAVRAGPVLAGNLARALDGAAPRRWRPQARALALIGLGDGRALGAWGPLAVEGALAGALKRRLDRAFVRRYAGD